MECMIDEQIRAIDEVDTNSINHAQSVSSGRPQRKGKQSGSGWER